MIIRASREHKTQESHNRSAKDIEGSMSDTRQDYKVKACSRKGGLTIFH
jgi:hypothetical protein